MSHKLLRAVASSVLLVLCTQPARAAETQILHGHVPRAVIDQKLQAIGRLPPDTSLQLAIGLPFRNQQGLSSFLKDLYTPASANFRQYLTPQQFTERFGPTAQDYQNLLEFARSNGLTVAGTFSNRVLLDIKASAADIERVFHVTMRLYQHPTETRTFFAPDVEPSLDLTVPVLHISGLDSYIIPHRVTQQRVGTERAANGTPTGSGPSHTFLAQDIRAAYVPGVTLNGNGQWVGLLEYNGYYNDLIQDYAAYNGLPPPTGLNVENWAMDGFNGNPKGTGYYEVQADIEMVLAMAPGVTEVIVYELPPPTSGIPIPPDDALNLMAAQGLCNQLSSSWEFNLSLNTDMIFQELAAQGQSFFQASGDGGGRTGTNVFSPFDDPYITLVGGTELTTTDNGAYSSEVVYNEPAGQGNYFSYSGGGISPTYSIPWWQEGISMSANGGSTTMRNMPDVAIVAFDVFTFYSETVPKSGGYSGTSVAAPLWAGFMALVNEQASAEGRPPIGFANPSLYAIGKGSSYHSCFHDITVGNNKNPLSLTAFDAVAGYDLCTGWGTPKGQALINALCSTAKKPVRKAQYDFDGTLASSVPGAPALVSVDPLGKNGFVLDNVNGQTQKVFAWVGNAYPVAQQAGLSLDTTGLVSSNSYSVEMIFKLTQRDSAWRRLIDVENRQSDDGFYVDPGNNLAVFPIISSVTPFRNGVYEHVVLTVDRGVITASLNGVLQFSGNSTLMNIANPGKLMNFFLDNTVGGGQGEFSNGSIALLRLYSGALSSPSVSISSTAGNTLVFSWPSSFAGFVLEQSPDLNPNNWSAVTAQTPTDDGTNNVLVVTPQGGSMYYRLLSQ